ncbi:MAG: S49 family peptidase, partial [Flavobacteriales bacterium]|nr:S49 family peptidase [Flavobacteriales bacterium]
MNFWKSVFASLVGSSIFVGVFVIFFIFIIGALVSGGENEQVTKVKDNSILHLNFDTPIVERGNDKEFQIDFATFEPKMNLGLNDILADIKKASKDDKIKGIFLDISSVMASPSSVQDIRRALVEFKESGKWIVAFSEGYSQGAYYLASASDEVYLYPEGGLDFAGLSTELMFFKNMLDELEVDVQIVRGPDNKYKSAVEPFMYDKMSDANREQMDALLGGIWNEMIADMSESRSLTPAVLNQVADSLSIRIAEDALELGFVDGLKY